MHRILPTAACATLFACGGDRTATTTNWQLRATVGSDSTTATPDSPRAIVWSSTATKMPTPAAGASTPLVLAFGDELRCPTDIDAVVVADHGAAAAVDLALLFCSGIAPPPKLPLGARIVNAANQAAGGTTRPAPGDVVLQLLRQQHAGLLTTAPSTDVVFPIGLLCCADDPISKAIAAAARTAARRYPQLELLDRADTPGAATLAPSAREFVQRGVRAILVVLPTHDAPPLTAVQTAAAEQNIAVFALDPSLQCTTATCVVGSDAQILGRAAGETLLGMTGGPGPIQPVLATPADASLFAARLRGMAAALGLPEPK